VHAEVVDLLSGKGQFQTEQALVVARAIDMAIEKTQLVTVPIMDTRFAAVDVRFAAVDARFAAVNARLDALEIKIERWAIRMIIAMVASQAALGPFGASALGALRGVLSTLGH
jgi:hypothetical protein